MRPARRNMCCSSLQAASRQRFAIPCATPHSQHRTLDEPSIRQQVDLCELALASTDLVSISSRRTTCSLLLPLPLSVPSIAASVRFSIVATSKRDFLQNTALYAHQAEVCRNKRGWVSRQGHERRRPRRRECRLGSSAHMCALVGRDAGFATVRASRLTSGRDDAPALCKPGYGKLVSPQTFDQTKKHVEDAFAAPGRQLCIMHGMRRRHPVPSAARLAQPTELLPTAAYRITNAKVRVGEGQNDSVELPIGPAAAAAPCLPIAEHQARRPTSSHRLARGFSYHFCQCIQMGQNPALEAVTVSFCRAKGKRRSQALIYQRQHVCRSHHRPVLRGVTADCRGSPAPLSSCIHPGWGSRTAHGRVSGLQAQGGDALSRTRGHMPAVCQVHLFKASACTQPEASSSPGGPHRCC